MRATVIAALLLAGCSSTPNYIWEKPGMTASEKQADVDDCSRRANRPAHYYIPIPVFAMDDIYNNCMLDRGYRRVIKDR